jgi:predicted transcriptional regulator
LANNSIDGGFIVIPKRTLKCEEYKTLKASTKVVFQSMLTEFIRDKKKNPKNKVRMSINQIAEISGIGRTTVWRSLATLEAAGFLKTSKQGGLENNTSEYEMDGRFLW